MRPRRPARPSPPATPFTTHRPPFRAQMGPCPAGVSAWSSQACNAGGLDGIPLDVTVLIFTAPWLLQTFMRGARLEVIILTYAVQAVVMNLALTVAGSTLHPWLNLLLVEGLACSYEMDRHSRKVFLSQQEALHMVKKNSRLQVEMARRDLDAKRAMVRHISHEIRTPLNITAVGMDTMLRTLQKVPPSSTRDFMQETVESCVVACEDALTIVTELLDFEKLAAGLCTLEKVPTRLVPWVADTVKAFRVTAESKGIKVGFVAYTSSPMSRTHLPHPSTSSLSLTPLPHPSPSPMSLTHLHYHPSGRLHTPGDGDEGGTSLGSRHRPPQDGHGDAQFDVQRDQVQPDRWDGHGGDENVF